MFKNILYNLTRLILFFHIIGISFGENLLIQFKGEYIDYSDNSLKELIDLPEDLKMSKWLSSATREDAIGESNLSLIFRISNINSNTYSIISLKNILSKKNVLQRVEIENTHNIHYLPNDPLYSEQWYLDQIYFQEALDLWDIPDGNIPNLNDVLLVAVDVGVDWTHSELAPNIWQNLDEDADNDGRTIECNGLLNGNICNGDWVLDPGDLNGIDDDNWDADPTTLIDDLIGWDFVGNNGNSDNDPRPNLPQEYYSGWNHGTHIAGILSALTNNNDGISSASYNGQLMPLKCAMEDDGQNLSIVNGFDAILYAAKKGYYSDLQTIINTSWGSDLYSHFELETVTLIYENYNGIIVSSAGNGFNNQQINAMTFPASYEPVISVTPLGANDFWNHWANFHYTVDISAPGENIFSTSHNNQFSIFTGSSQACPIVASGIALLSAYRPNYNAEQLIEMIIETTDSSIYNINSEYYLQGNLGQGRLNLETALLTPLFPKFTTSINTMNILNDIDGIASAGDSIQITLNLHCSNNWGNADSVFISPYVTNPEIQLYGNDIFVSHIESGESIPLTENELTIIFSPELVSGIYNIYLSINANQHHPGMSFHSEIALSLFIYDIIYYGDVNYDQNVDVMDVLITQEIIFGNLSELQYAVSNVNLNFDDTLNIIDVLLIIQKILTD